MSVSVCLSVCLSVRLHIKKQHVQILPYFLSMLPMVVARLCDDTAIRSVLPVLWMTSCFLIMATPNKLITRRRRQHWKRILMSAIAYVSTSATPHNFAFTAGSVKMSSVQTTVAREY